MTDVTFATAGCYGQEGIFRLCIHPSLYLSQKSDFLIYLKSLLWYTWVYLPYVYHPHRVVRPASTISFSDVSWRWVMDKDRLAEFCCGTDGWQ